MEQNTIFTTIFYLLTNSSENYHLTPFLYLLSLIIYVYVNYFHLSITKYELWIQTITDGFGLTYYAMKQVQMALVATSADSVPSSYLVRITIAPIGTTFGNLQ